MNNKIFISYPHKPEQCVQHVIMALKKRLADNGFDVWLDERIKTGHDWRQEITKGLQESEWVLVFLNSHATRKDSICLDEIAMAARYKRGQIVSVLLEPEEAIKTPLVLGRIQFVKMEEWEKKYKENKGGNAWNVWLQKQADELIAAFERREDLLQRGELDLLHEVLQPDQYWDEIANRLDGFVGREWVIKEITQKLKVPDGPRMLWLNGGPGIGKTSIAARLAHDLELPAAGVYFCRFDRSQTHSAHNVIRTLAYQMACTVPAYRQMLVRQLHLGIDSNYEKIYSLKDELNKLTVYQLFKKLLVDPTYIGGEPHLLIIDGLDEITTEGGDNEIAKLLAGQEFRSMQKWLRVLITSRQDALLKELLSHVEATTINAQSTENLADLREYLEQQTCLGYGDIRNKAIETLLARSEGAFVYLSKTIDALNRGMLSPEQPDLFPTDLNALYRNYMERAYPNAKQFKEDARPLLELILASPEPLPIGVAVTALEVDSYFVNEFVAAMGALLDVDLFEREQRLSLFHRSFAEWLKQAMPPYSVDKNIGRFKLASCLWQVLLSQGVFAHDGFVAEAFSLVFMELSTKQIREILGEPSDKNADCLEEAAGILIKAYKLNQALSFCEISISEIELHKGPNYPDVARPLNKLAYILASKDDFDSAELHLRRALEIQVKSLGLDHKDTAKTLFNLGKLLQSKGDYVSSELLVRKVLKNLETVLGAEHPYMAMALENLAINIFNSKSDYDVAVSLLNRALDINETVYGSNHPKIADTLETLAEIFRINGSLIDAESLLRRSLAIKEEFSEPCQPDLAESFSKLATLLKTKGDYDGAESLLKRALEILESVYGHNNSKTAKILSKLAEVLNLKNDCDGAETLLRRALEIQEKILGADHQDVAATLNALATIHAVKGDFDDAESCYCRALEISEKGLGPDHPHASNVLYNLAMLLIKSRSDYDRAEAFLRRSLEISEKKRGANHLMTLQILFKLRELHKAKRQLTTK